MTPTDHEKILDRLAALLRSKPRTAREIAAEMKCCRPTAYERVRALMARGDGVYEVHFKATGSRPGPSAIAYGIRD